MVTTAHHPAAAAQGGGLLGPNASFHSLASSHTNSAAALATAAAVAAMQAALPSPTGGLAEDGAQSAQRGVPAAPFLFGAAPVPAGLPHHARQGSSVDNLLLAAGGASASLHGAVGGDSGGPAAKKKRTRNADQMEQNRQAQQKYRERKKAEHEQLQKALEQMAAQLAAMKALEVRFRWCACVRACACVALLLPVLHGGACVSGDAAAPSRPCAGACGARRRPRP